MGSQDGSRPAQPSPDAIAKGMAAWEKWMSDHARQVVDSGGPLGKTKKTSKAGVAEAQNAVAGYVIVEADSHDAAARMFLNHPHFAIFPGDSVEIMEVLPIPTR
jgi:F420-dependent methylenetetrahydromethanopterin dehydrogenase